MNSDTPVNNNVLPQHPEGVRHGPKGGNLDNPAQYPWRREAPYNPIPMPDGGLGLHVHPEKQYRNSATGGLQKEQSWHAMAVFMTLAGRSNIEIAQAANVNPAVVSQLKAQLWFQQKLAIAENNAGEAYLGLIYGEAIASVQKVIAIRDTSENERMQLQAATWLAEQAHGKAVQKIETKVQHSHRSPADELAELEQELANIRAGRSAPAAPAIVQPIIPASPLD
jgi:hypothetical protein